MWHFLLQRFIGIVCVFACILVGVFLLPRLVQLDPCLVTLGENTTDKQLAICHAEHHLDQSLLSQFFQYSKNLLRGDLGISIHTGRSVLADLCDRLPATLELSFAALLIMLFIGFPLGILAAYYHQTWLGHSIGIFTIVCGAVPVFLLGLLLKESFSGPIAWFPRTGRISTLNAILTGNIEAFQNALLHLAIPALTLGVYTSAVLARIIRTALLDVLPMPYIQAARGRGISNQRIFLMHALKNAMVPALTIVGLTMGNLFSGTVLTEYVFSWPGIGRYLAEAAITNDFPVIIGVSLVTAFVYPLSHLLIECLQRWIDPHVGLVRVSPTMDWMDGTGLQ